jgi:hypothetical protein
MKIGARHLAGYFAPLTLDKVAKTATLIHYRTHNIF